MKEEVGRRPRREMVRGTPVSFVTSPKALETVNQQKNFYHQFLSLLKNGTRINSKVSDSQLS